MTYRSVFDNIKEPFKSLLNYFFMKKIFFLVIFSSLMLAGCGQGEKTGQSMDLNDVIGPEEAKAKAEKHINDAYGRAGSPPLTVGEVEDAGFVYKLDVKVPNGVFQSYISKDGRYFFVEGDDMDGKKSDKPKVELFVMSHCPYGTQIEKGILPVLDLLGDKIDFELKFCDFAMHPQQGELEEQLTQYCVQEQDQEKLKTYLGCFLDKGVTSGCLDKAGVDKQKLDKCVKQTDEEYKITAGLEDKSTWRNGTYPKFNIHKDDAEKYGVSGSPTLIINGKEANAGKRSPQGLLDTICSYFNEKPEECDKSLSDETPSPGFGYGEASSASAGSCN